MGKGKNLKRTEKKNVDKGVYRRGRKEVEVRGGDFYDGNGVKNMNRERLGRGERRRSRDEGRKGRRN